MVFSPVHERLDLPHERLPQLAKLIFDLGGNSGVNRAMHEAVSFQLAECLGEHAFGNIANGPLQFGEAVGAVRQCEQGKKAPAIPDVIQNVAHRTKSRVVGAGQDRR